MHKLCQEAAEQILNEFKPTLMIAIGGGGYVPARILRYVSTTPQPLIDQSPTPHSVHTFHFSFLTVYIYTYMHTYLFSTYLTLVLVPLITCALRLWLTDGFSCAKS